jgi:hypothetical protein
VDIRAIFRLFLRIRIFPAHFPASSEILLIILDFIGVPVMTNVPPGLVGMVAQNGVSETVI